MFFLMDWPTSQDSVLEQGLSTIPYAPCLGQGTVIDDASDSASQDDAASKLFNDATV